MPNEDRMQTFAFCFENQAVEPAQSAHQHKEDHYFCPEENCLIEVRPAHRKNFFFRARKGRLHNPKCCYYKEPTEETGNGDPQPRPTPNPCTPIPTQLGPPERRMAWREPTREELLAMIQQANNRPHLVSGTLEEVVSAWENMTQDERANSPLLIGNEQLSYSDAFVFLATATDQVTQLPWGNRILYGAADFIKGKCPGIIFVNSVRRLILEEHRLALSLMLRATNYSEGTNRAYIQNIPLPSRGTMFWRGEMPILSDDEKRLVLQFSEDIRYQGFALRQRIIVN